MSEERQFTISDVARQNNISIGEALERSRALRFAVADEISLLKSVSLWKVTDEATTCLMDDFHRRLPVGESLAGTLRKAKMDLRARGFQDPVFWAAVACVEDAAHLCVRPNQRGDA